MDRTNDIMKPTSTQKHRTPNITRTIIATTPITSDDIRKSWAELSFLMLDASLVLFRIKTFLRLSIDSCRVWFTNLQTHVQKVLFVSMVYVISSVTVEVVRAVLVVISIVVVSGKHKTVLDGLFLLQNEHVEHPGTFILMLHWLRKHEFSELSVEYPLQFMSWSHSDLHIFSSPLSVLYGYKAVEDKMGELYPTAWTKKAEMYTFIIWDRIWSDQNMIPQVHVFFYTTFTQVIKLEVFFGSIDNEHIPCHTQTR